MPLKKEDTIDLILYTEGACVIAQERPYGRVSFFTFYQNKMRNIDRQIARLLDNLDETLPLTNGIKGSALSLLERYYDRQSVPTIWASNCHRMWR